MVYKGKSHLEMGDLDDLRGRTPPYYHPDVISIRFLDWASPIRYLQFLGLLNLAYATAPATHHASVITIYHKILEGLSIPRFIV